MPKNEETAKSQKKLSEKKTQRTQKSQQKSQQSREKSKEPKSDQKDSAQSQTAPPPATQEERTMILEVIREGNPQHLYTLAQKVSAEKSQLMIGTQLRLGKRLIKITKEIRREPFGYVYEANVDNVMRFVKTEPIADDKDELERFRILKMELAILQRSGEHKKLKHFAELVASGSTPNFKFIVIQRLGPDLYELTRTLLRSAFSCSTALRVCIQTLNALTELHTLGFLHRFLRPQCFAIGSLSNIRSVYFFDFGLPLLFRDPEIGYFREPNQLSRMLGSLRYMSRNSHLNRELARRDDLESWLYLSLEFFDLRILPWRNETVSASALETKQKLADGKYPELYDSTSHRFHQILRYITNIKFEERPDYLYIMKLLREIRVELNIDFEEPYDWEDKRAQKSKEKSKTSVKAAASPSPPPPPPPPPMPPKPPIRKTVTPQPDTSASSDVSADPPPPSPPKPKPKRISVKSTQKDENIENINVGTNPQFLDLLVDVDMADDGHNSLDSNAE